MGTPIPDGIDPIYPDFWYCTKLAIHPTGQPDDPCPEPDVDFISRCLIGSDILDWIDAGYQCTSTPLVSIPLFNKQRLVNIGPAHATATACNAAGCPIP